ncbi:MAG: hypothetical protein IKE66_01735 [Hyphomicrobium sp.]|nr:hypothetical protein [Hyphomicrobium sp.]
MVAMAAVTAASPAIAVTEGWDHKKNITDAAKRLVVLHKREGSTGVLKFLEACYKTHLLSSQFTAGLESCMAQDLMHAQILAIVYSRLPPERIKQMGAPTPEIIAKSMNARLTSSFMQYKVTVKEGEEFKRLVKEHGMPIFLSGIFPNAAPGNGAAKPEN